MSPPAVFERESHPRRSVPVSRVIPRTLPASGGALRKKPQSVTVDGRVWAKEGPGLGRTRQKPLPGLVQAMLPQPAVCGQRWRLATSVAVDFVVVMTNFAALSHLRLLLEFAIRRNWPAFLRPWSFPISAVGPLLLQGALLTLLGYSEGLYRAEMMRAPREERFIVAKVVTWSTLLVGMAIHFGIDEISMAAVLAGAPLNYLGMLGWREWRRQAAASADHGRGERNVLIVGGGKLAHEVADYFEQHRALGCVVRGFVVEEGPTGGDVLGRVEDLAQVARAEFVDEVILAMPERRDLAREAIREARRSRLDVKIVPDLFGFEPQAPAFENLGSVPVLTLYEEPIPALGLFLKRVVDVVGSAAGLVGLAPVLAAIALVIKLDSAGPVFYRAPRVGKKGRKFLCYKFRTMVTNADQLKAQLRGCNERQGPCFKIAHDPRITRVGRFLRRYSMDEVPQLLNVLKGEMSLVGPRPHPVDDFEHYDLEDLRRLDVTPGITGLWQVTARRDPSFQRNMALDLEYIESWNLWMDLQILCRTVSAVLEGSGA